MPVPVDRLFALASTPQPSTPQARAAKRRATRTVWSMLGVVLVNIVLVSYVAVEVGMSSVGGQVLALSGPGTSALAGGAGASSTSVAADAPSTAPPQPSTTAPTASRRGTPPAAARRSAPATVRPAPARAGASTSVPTTSSPASGEVPRVVVPTSTTMAMNVNIPPAPDFLTACGSNGDNGGPQCVDEVTRAIDNARSALGLAPIELPTNWGALDAPQQLFVATNLERTARGLAPVAGEVPALDAAAASAASAGADPAVPRGFPATGFASNWAGWIGNPLEAMYYWMYDDGLGSPNRDCTQADLGACWGHRQNVLFSSGCNPCVMGGAWGTTPRGTTSVTELIVATQVPQGADFTWAGELTYLP